MLGKIKKTILIGLMLCVFILSSIPVSAAQDPQFRLDIDSLNLTIGTSANFVISLTDAQGAQIVSIEGLENFDELNQSSTNYTSIINGTTTMRYDINYAVMPKTAGKFTLKAIILYNGQHYETNALEVAISNASDAQAQSSPEIFIKTVLSHESAYLGEKIVLTYELYTMYNLSNYGFTESLSIDGVVLQNAPNDPPQAEYVYVDGNRYVKYTVIQLIVDPIKSGSCSIPSFNFQVNVITDGGGFFSSTKAEYLQTEAKEFTAKPLPTAGKPTDFSGIVGEFYLDGSYSRNQLNYGDSTTLHVTAAGSCNLGGINTILSGETHGVSAYEILKNSVEIVQDNKYYSEKSFEVILVPEEPGTLETAPISISYFNPTTELYEKAEISSVSLEVLGSIHAQNNNNNNGNSVSYIPTETIIVSQVNYTDIQNDGYFSINLKKELVYGILIGFAVLLVLTSIVIWLLLTRKKQDEALKTIYKQLISSNNTSETYDLLNSMIKHCFKISIKANSRSTVLNAIPDGDLAEKLTEVMDYMESSEVRDEKRHAVLKEKIKVIYRRLA